MTKRSAWLLFGIFVCCGYFSQNASADQVTAFASRFNQRPLCIDVPNSQYAAGTQLNVYPCQHSPNQSFKVTDQGPIVTAANAKICVDAFRPSGGPSQIGDVIGLWTCQSSANQSWAFMGDYTDNTSFKIVIRNAPSLCVTVAGYDAQKQVGKLVLQACGNNDASQLFRKY